MSRQSDIVEEAVAWHLASQHDDMDWDAFTSWLEADPAHMQAYDQIGLTHAALGDMPAPIPFQAANDEPARAYSGWRKWAGTAVAASLLVLVGVPLMRGDPATVYRSQAESMTITLDDGSSIVLAPASQLTIDGENQEQIALNGGAYFDIRHDPARQLSITAGPLVISDIGTSFDVQVAGAVVRVAVSEGRVDVGSARLSDSVQLAAGRQLQFDGVSGRSVAAPVETAAVGSWRSGQLSYAATPLSLVSADLNRYAGVHLDVPDQLGDRLFSGTLALNDETSAMRDLSQLMGLALERVDGGYRLSEPAD